MSFKVKQPKVAAAPETPAQDVAPQTLPTSDRKRRLSTGGRQSTFLGSLGAAALARGGATLTGAGG
ncbi:MAG: hypothetical protein DI570_09220 [Phenylobacterium zucineum]|nr:MAG: hypothetical protein DI570_09220 [Phenylobacterium zucineum]